jgi:zinc transport system permease protein
MAALSLAVAAYLFFTYNRVLLLGVHEGFARSLGIRGRALEISFSLAVALVVTTAIRAVGILLVTALLVVPAAAARNVTHGAATAFWTAIAISLLSGVAGIAASYHLDTATGATIVLFAAALFALTALIRAARGETS